LRTTVAVGAALALAAALAAGIPLALLADPRNWGRLASGIAGGLDTLPSVRVPYAGLDEWTRVVLILGGGLLTGAGALLAFAPRRDRGAGFQTLAAIALAALYAVPAIQRELDHPFLVGVAFALLLAVFLWLERVDRTSAPSALILVCAACLLALVLAPRLDGAQPLIDYEQLAQSLSGGVQTTYTWDHTYGPLDWPRDGREVLRVKARDRAYWKATNLTEFDGFRWKQDTSQRANTLDTPLRHDKPQWRQTIDVTMRALRSSRFVAAGTALEIRKSPVKPIQTAPGIYESADKPLQRGNTYEAVVYTPRPTATEMRDSTQDPFGTPYGEELRRAYSVFELPPRSGSLRARSAQPRFGMVPLWGEQNAPFSFRTIGDPSPQPLDFATTPYARTYALAQRLKAGARTPYDYVLAVERYLAKGYEYSETPPRSRYPLEAFLFKDRAGYCQQFSGAEALLLRLGGVPARIAAGFAPGSRNSLRGGQFVVRDIDAHSWVEVFFPGIGWVTRDPTPAGSPARSQIADLATTNAGDSSSAIGARTPAKADGSSANAGGGVAATAKGGGDSVWPYAGAGLLALVLLAAAGVLWLRVAQRRRDAQADDPQVAELARALRRAGRPPRPDLTLDALARRFADTPAESYVRELASARFGYGAGTTTRAQRAGLRRELTRGLGVTGRARAWWALPPRV
jgi:transglutaminase-like putative cysteine protease